MSIVTVTTSEPDIAAQTDEPGNVNITTELLELFEKSLAEKAKLANVALIPNGANVIRLCPGRCKNAK
jgi:hypothetical protein